MVFLSTDILYLLCCPVVLLIFFFFVGGHIHTQTVIESI